MTVEHEVLRKRLIRLMADLRVRQSGLADLLFVERQAVSNWMTGKNMPHDSTMGLIEELERNVAKDPGMASVEAVYQQGVADLRLWLRDFTDRVAAAQALHPENEKAIRAADKPLATPTAPDAPTVKHPPAHKRAK